MDADWPGQPPDYSKPPRGELTVAQVAAMIDHSLLRPELTLDAPPLQLAFREDLDDEPIVIPELDP